MYTRAQTFIEVNPDVTPLPRYRFVKDNSGVLAPLLCPLHDDILLGVWPYEEDIEVLLIAPKLASIAHSLQWQWTEGVIWEGERHIHASD